MELPKGGVGRAVYALASLFFLVFLGSAAGGLRVGWTTSGLLDGALKFAAIELLGLFLLVFLLTLLWCAATPAWVERLLARRGPRALVAGVACALALLALLLAVEGIRAFGG